MGKFARDKVTKLQNKPNIFSGNEFNRLLCGSLLALFVLFVWKSEKFLLRSLGTKF